MYDAMIPDLILTNANIITLDPLRPRAQLVTIYKGKVLSVGHKHELEKFKGGKSSIIDCYGKTIIPGFIDAHFHLSSFAESLVTMDLKPRNNLCSIADIQTKIRELSKKQPSGTWIRCGGYNEFCLREKRHPTRWDLDLASSVHPIKLTHRTGHAHVLNSLALKLTGISKETPDPEGCLIERDIGTGGPTGLLYGMGELISKSVPPLDSHQLDQGIVMANRELLSLGITSVQDASSRNDTECWDRFQRWKDQGYLKPRVSMMLGVQAFEKYRKKSFPNKIKENQLRIAGVKIMVDETTGRLNPSQDELNELVFDIHTSGFQAVIHAIDEPAIEAACTAIDCALQRSPRSDHRHRIEHCSVGPPSLARRLASLGAIVVTQPPFIYYSGDRYLETIPRSQLKSLYPLATLLKHGVHLAGSSDCPIAPPNPLTGIYAAISRMSETGRFVVAKERINPLEALRMYTEYAARASFEENIKGSITPGKLADLVVLSGDPTTVPIEEIKDIQVEMTILNGETVWDKGD
jgi:predicted amidohydrolase YtcJ